MKVVFGILAILCVVSAVIAALGLGLGWALHLMVPATDLSACVVTGALSVGVTVLVIMAVAVLLQVEERIRSAAQAVAEDDAECDGERGASPRGRSPRRQPTESGLSHDSRPSVLWASA